MTIHSKTLVIIISFFAGFINYSFSASKNTNASYYPADLSEGLIGFTADKPVDNPGDNVFQISLETLPTETASIWLTYELYGVQDHTAVSRSINDEFAQGDYLVKKSEESLS